MTNLVEGKIVVPKIHKNAQHGHLQLLFCKAKPI